MKKIRLGKTELMVTKTALGCLPIQRRDKNAAVEILRRAYEAGINFFDTANAYTDSEEKIGLALSDVRKNVIIATKSMDRSYDGCMKHIENSLKMLKTDYIDIFQFHNVSEVPDPEDKSGAFAAVLKMKEQGAIRHIGVTSHKAAVAKKCIESGYFETLQFPYSYISDKQDTDLAEQCKEQDMGFIAMKGLAGGLLSNARICHAFMKDKPVVPIWGVQTMEQLEEWLALDAEDPSLDAEMQKIIEADRAQLGATFCRSCGYCMPCPVEIPINQCARMNMLLRRSPYKQYMSDEWYETMHRIDNCLQCGQCKSKCPYGLDTPALLKYMLADYDEFYAQHKDD